MGVISEQGVMAQNWIMIISELRRYQGVSYKSDITVISGLDPGDRQVLEHKYIGCDPPCLLDSSDGRFVLKGAAYNPMDVMNCLMIRRGYRMQGLPQQRTLPNIHNKDDKFCLIYHLSKECPLKRAHTTPAGLGILPTPDCSHKTNSKQDCQTTNPGHPPQMTRPSITNRINSAPPQLSDTTQQQAAIQ